MGTKEKETSPEDVLELLRTLEKINDINLDRLSTEKFEALRPVDQLVETLKRDKTLRRGPKDRSMGTRKKVHWKTKRRKWREQYHRNGKRYRLAKIEKQLSSPEGWYEYLIFEWKKDKVDFFTREEWLEVIWPALGGKVPYFNRYDTKKGFTLDNVVVYETGTRKVLFDGKEHLLRKMGYIL